MSLVWNIRAILLHMHFWGLVNRGDDPAGYRTACNSAYDDFSRWRRANKVNSSQKRFSYWTVFKEEYGCYLNSKGYNARVLSAWLEDVLERSQTAPPPQMVADDRTHLCLVAVTTDLYYTSKFS